MSCPPTNGPVRKPRKPLPNQAGLLEVAGALGGRFENADLGQFGHVFLHALVDIAGDVFRAGAFTVHFRVLVEIGMVQIVDDLLQFALQYGKIEGDIGLVQGVFLCPSLHHVVMPVGILAFAAVVQKVMCSSEMFFNHDFKHTICLARKPTSWQVNLMNLRHQQAAILQLISLFAVLASARAPS
jgi:hypothetical protein